MKNQMTTKPVKENPEVKNRRTKPLVIPKNKDHGNKEK